MLWIYFYYLNRYCLVWRRIIFVQPPHPHPAYSKPCHQFCCSSNALLQKCQNAKPRGFYPLTVTNHICNSSSSKSLSCCLWSSGMSLSWQHQPHTMLSLLKRAYLAFKLVTDLHLYNLYSKVYKGFFYPSRNDLVSAVQLNVNEFKFAGLVINFVFFVQHLDLFYCPEERKKKSIKI